MKEIDPKARVVTFEVNFRPSEIYNVRQLSATGGSRPSDMHHITVAINVCTSKNKERMNYFVLTSEIIRVYKQEPRN